MQYPDPSQNYFELFGLSPAFEIDPSRLRDEQQRLQSTYHPDRFARSSEQEKRVSVQVAAWINQAYETLLDPVKRSRYLLELNGAELPDDSATTADSGFLMEQIELREEIESCRQDEDALIRCGQISLRLQSRLSELEQAFVSRLRDGELDEAMNCSLKMQFVQRLQQQLSEIQFELEDY